MGRRVIEIVATVLFAIFLAGALLMFAAVKLCPTVPSWLSGEDGVFLEGSRVESDVIGNLTIEGFVSKGLQDAVSAQVEYCIPCKAIVEMDYAAMQRVAIDAAALLHGYDVIPTFYGSTYVADRSRGVLSSLPWWGEVHVGEFREALEGLQEFADAHGELEWVLCTSTDLGLADINVANDLVAERITYDDLLGCAREQLSGIKVVDAQVVSEETRYEDLFTSDHHLQMPGAVKVYRRAIAALGREPVDLGEFFLASKGPYYGSLARNSLCFDYADEVYDVAYEHSDINVWIEGEAATLADVDRSYASELSEQANMFFSPYGFWFHPSRETIEFENNDLPEDAGALLMLSDSSDDSTDRLFAESYRRVYELDLRRYPLVKIDAFIRAHRDIEDVIVYASADRLIDSFWGTDADDGAGA